MSTQKKNNRHTCTVDESRGHTNIEVVHRNMKRDRERESSGFRVHTTIESVHANRERVHRNRERV